MKRGMFGAALLLALFLVSLLATLSMDRRHTPVARTLAAASDLAAAGAWEEAKTLAGGARADWQKHWHSSAAFADHKPMEEIDGLFARLEVYEKREDAAAFAAACAELSKRMEAMADAQRLSWWNLL